MRIGTLLLFVTAFGSSVFTLAAQTNASAGFNSEKDKASYAIGQGIGQQMKRQYLDINVAVVAEAMKDALSGKPSRLPDREAMETINKYLQECRNRLAEKNEKVGEAFLAENKKKPGIKTYLVTLPEGKSAEMQYKVISEGTGPVPGSNDMVTATFRGTLIDGTEYDSSANHKVPPRFALRNAQPGIRAALEMMKVGSKWTLYLPASLAYGNNGARNVEPGSAVICELELISDEAPKPITSDIIRVPSAEEMKKGAKIETIKAEDVEKMTAAQSKTNAAK
jgi:FKBP-type peptidyl-prolyl cis-trans isomerase